MADRSLETLWLVIAPDSSLPRGARLELAHAVASSQDALAAYRLGELTRDELQRIERAIERRDARYLASQGYES